jgi:hypothetical protein
VLSGLNSLSDISFTGNLPGLPSDEGNEGKKYLRFYTYCGVGTTKWGSKFPVEITKTLFRGASPFSFSFFFSILKIINKGIRQKEEDRLCISSLPGDKIG